MLQQLQDNYRLPLVFFQRKLSGSEKRYSVYDRELLAIHDSIKYIRHYLEGGVQIDHKPCQTLAARTQNKKCMNYWYPLNLETVIPSQHRGCGSEFCRFLPQICLIGRFPVDFLALIVFFLTSRADSVLVIPGNVMSDEDDVVG